MTDGQHVDERGRVAFAEMETKKKRRVRKAALAVFITALFMLSSVMAMALNTKAATEEKIFVVAMGEGVQSANPWIGIYDSDYILYSYIYDYLMYPGQDGNATPNLAKSWWFMDGNTAIATGESTAADLKNRNGSAWPMGSIWEYNLTEGVTWSDGAPFTADDVKYTVDLQTGVNYATFWAYQPYTRWIDHCQKVNDYKVRYFFTDRSNTSNPAAPVAWGNCISFPIMPKHLLQEKSPVEIAQNWTGVPAIGTGPFKGTDILDDEIIAKEKLTLVKNPEWDNGLGRIYSRTCEIEKLIMKFYSEEQVLILDLKTKKIDATEVTAINYLSLMNATDKPPELKLVSQFSSTVYSKISHFNFATTAPGGGLNPARLDPALHRACALATNRQSLADDVFKGLAVPGVGLVSPVFKKWYYDAWTDTQNISWFNVTSDTGAILYADHGPIADAMDFNITKANEILDAAGYVWSGVIGEYRTVGDVAAKRLKAMGAVADLNTAKIDPKTGNPRILEFEDILEQEVFEDAEISKYYQSEWKNIGVKMNPTLVNTATWNKVVYGLQENFAETYWSGDPDPNYLLYCPTSYAMDGWNEWGVPAHDPSWWNPTLAAKPFWDHVYRNTNYYDVCYELSARTYKENDTLTNGVVAKATDYGRIHWVQECNKYLFLSGAGFMTTVYPKAAYGYLDWRWTNFGDWVAHPGLQVDHFWGETPLYLKIKWNPNYNSAGGVDIIPIAVAIAAVMAAIAVIIVLRKQKSQKMMEAEDEEEDEEEEPEEPDDEDND